MYEKAIGAVLILILLLSLAACGQKEQIDYLVLVNKESIPTIGKERRGPLRSRIPSATTWKWKKRRMSHISD